MEISDLRGEDLIIGFCGNVKCRKGKSADFYANERRNYYNLNYVVNGNGTLCYGGKKLAVEPGDLFIIPPSSDIRFVSEEDCGFYTVHAEGKLVPALMKGIGLDENNCSVHCGNDVRLTSTFLRLIECFGAKKDPDLKCRGLFYILMGELYEMFEELTVKRADTVKRNADYYIRAAVSFLKYNLYYTGVTLDSVAKNVGINKNYLCTVFRKAMGVSPMQYLIRLRMETAAKRFEETDDPVSAVAKFVGYKDQLHFSKAFHAYHGMSPSRYRELHHVAKKETNDIPGINDIERSEIKQSTDSTLS